MKELRHPESHRKFLRRSVTGLAVLAATASCVEPRTYEVPTGDIATAVRIYERLTPIEQLQVSYAGGIDIIGPEGEVSATYGGDCLTGTGWSPGELDITATQDGAVIDVTRAPKEVQNVSFDPFSNGGEITVTKEKRRMRPDKKIVFDYDEGNRDYGEAGFPIFNSGERELFDTVCDSWK